MEWFDWIGMLVDIVVGCFDAGGTIAENFDKDRNPLWD